MIKGDVIKVIVFTKTFEKFVAIPRRSSATKTTEYKIIGVEMIGILEEHVEGGFLIVPEFNKSSKESLWCERR